MPDILVPTFERDPDKIYPGYAMFGAAVLELHERGQAWELEHDINFDLIVGAPRGALELMSRMSQLMLLKGPEVVAVSSSAYDVDNNRTLTTHTRIPDPSMVKGRHCLVVDDVSDSGKGEKSIVDALQAAGAKSATTLDWYFKPNKNETGIAPDIHLEVTDAWIKFPWEMYEEYSRAKTRLTSEGASQHDLEQLKQNYMKSQGLL